MVSAAYQVERINITDYTIKGCLGYDACRKDPARPGCIQRDDAGAILRLQLEADVIVYATPLYAWGFTAQMKSLLDRHYCLVKGRAAG